MWGKGYKGPYACPLQTHFTDLGINAGIVSFPAEFRTGGLLGWVSLEHEVAGHHFLHLFPENKLIIELKEEIKKRFNIEIEEIKKNGKAENKSDTTVDQSFTTVSDMTILRDYWYACTEEATCDVLGTLNTGPAFGMGLLGYLKGWRGGKLRSSGLLHTDKKTTMLFFESDDLIFETGKNIVLIKNVSDFIVFQRDEGIFGNLIEGSTKIKNLKYQKFNLSSKHPLDLLRPFLCSETIRFFNAKSEWINKIEKEANTDKLNNIELVELKEQTDGSFSIEKKCIAKQSAIKSARIVANVVAHSKMEILSTQALIDIFKWTQEDESFVTKIQKDIDDPNKVGLPNCGGKFAARHIIAASILSAIQDKGGGSSIGIERIEQIFNRMKKYLVNLFENM